MKIYDYSNLLKVIDNINHERKELEQTHQQNLEKQFESLMPELISINSDWLQLNKLLKETGVRHIEVNCGRYSFFHQEKVHYFGNADTHISPYGGTPHPNIYDKRKYITTSIPPMTLADKIGLCNDLIEYYPVFREIALNEVYVAIGKKAEDNERFRSEHNL